MDAYGLAVAKVRESDVEQATQSIDDIIDAAAPQERSLWLRVKDLLMRAPSRQP